MIDVGYMVGFGGDFGLLLDMFCVFSLIEQVIKMKGGVFIIVDGYEFGYVIELYISVI